MAKGRYETSTVFCFPNREDEGTHREIRVTFSDDGAQPVMVVGKWEKSGEVGDRARQYAEEWAAEGVEILKEERKAREIVSLARGGDGSTGRSVKEVGNRDIWQKEEDLWKGGLPQSLCYLEAMNSRRVDCLLTKVTFRWKRNSNPWIRRSWDIIEVYRGVVTKPMINLNGNRRRTVKSVQKKEGKKTSKHG